MIKERVRKPKSYKIFICVGISVLLAVFVYIRYSVFLRTDDVGIRNILSGLYTGEPEAHTMFILYPLTWVLAKMYKIFPQIDWYFLFLESVHYVCLALILYVIVRYVEKHTVLVAVFLTALFTAFWLPNLTTLEWTTTAGILSATAVIWYFFIPVDEGGGIKVIIEYSVAVILLVLSCNLRNEVFLMTIPFMGMAVLVKWFRNKKVINKKFIVKEVAYFCITFIVIAFSFVIDDIAYSSEEWQEAESYSHYRARIVDRYGYPSYEENEDVYQANGITEEMYDVMEDDYNYMLASKGILTSKNLEEIEELSKNNYYENESFLSELKQCIKLRTENAFGDNYGIYTIMFYVSIILAFFCALNRNDLPEMILDIVFVLGFESLWIYFYYTARLPIWVGKSIYLLGFSILIILLFKEPYLVELWQNRAILSVVTIGVLCMFGAEMLLVNNENQQQADKALLIQEAKTYCENNKDKVFYRDFHSFATNDGRDCVNEGDQLIAANFFPANGWTVNLPYSNQYMPTDGSQELCSWLSRQDNFYMLIISERSEGVCERTENLFKSRGIDCVMELDDVLNISNGDIVNVYHFTYK